ncbi:hypothetical protein K503DRAFT_799488 [Rhizopogon vinicolor AM-OR11-026]|uniref:Protein kinase domain-containing protein n=1 Tax=Rhizopogon vinicolor AM-OR11-026 TaxID=1314800 RepID=A0A1B7N454_9AGAM|nr:hypothetical protein K503DRAFT_799488 [Rhizopogon vinicolor AM-OR11-026]
MADGELELKVRRPRNPGRIVYSLFDSEVQYVDIEPPTRTNGEYTLRAPEVILAVDYGVQVDIWALGCMRPKIPKEAEKRIPDVNRDDSFIPETLSFQLLLSQLLAVIGPPAKATKCLESSFANAADVYEFWLAVQAAFLDVSQKNSVKLPTSVLEKICRLCNYRFNQMINEGPSDIFVTAIFFATRSAAILKKINPLTISPIRIQRTSSRVIYILPSMRRQLQVEYELKGEKIRDLDAGVALAKLNEQIIAYAKEAWPFNRLLTDKANTVKYWRDFLDHDSADILAYFAVKFFEITVNSMADERTASTVTWLNSALRSSQKGSTIIGQVQIRQWALMDPERNKKPPQKPSVKFRDLDKALLDVDIDSATVKGSATIHKRVKASWNIWIQHLTMWLTHGSESQG